MTKAIYATTNTGMFAKDFSLKDQIRRASVSIMSNIAEGFDRGNKGDFQRFLSIAKASCAEIQSQRYVALDANYINEQEFKHLQQIAKSLGRMIGGLYKKVRQ